MGFRDSTQKELQVFKHMEDVSTRKVVFEEFYDGVLKAYTVPTYVIDTTLYLPCIKTKLELKTKRFAQVFLFIFTKYI